MFNVNHHKAHFYILRLFNLSSIDSERSREIPLPTFDVPFFRTESIDIRCLYPECTCVLPVHGSSYPTAAIFKMCLFTHLFDEEGRS